MEHWEYVQKLSLAYPAKVTYAAFKAREFFDACEGQVYVALGGLDSITLTLFLWRYVNKDIPAVSVSVLEDRSIQEVHRWLGEQGAVTLLRPGKSKVEVLEQHGFPIISKDAAKKIEMLQNPSEANATTRHAILTGFTAEGVYSKYMHLPRKWRRLFYEQQAPFRVSAKCCYYMKEAPMLRYARTSKRAPYIGLMASEGGVRARALVRHGCNYFGSKQARSCPFTIFSRQDLLHLAVDLGVPVPSIYGVIETQAAGQLETTGAQRTGCSMCGFGVHMEARPHRFDQLRERSPKEWSFWMERIGWGQVLDYIGVPWNDGWVRPVDTEEG